MQGHAKQIGHSGEFWQNMVHWWREWQTTPVFLPEKPMNSMRRQTDTTPEDEPTRSEDVQYATGKEQRNSCRKNEEAGSRWKCHSVVAMCCGKSKVWCYKEQYCIGTWKVRSMNQDKSDVIKEEMTRVNISVLGISELEWTGMSEFNSDDHYIN